MTTEESFIQFKFLVKHKATEEDEDLGMSVIKLSPLMLIVPLSDERVKEDAGVVMGKTLLSFMNELNTEFDFHTLNYD